MAPGSEQAVEAVRAFILELRKIREVVVLEPPVGRELEFVRPFIAAWSLAFRAELAAELSPVLHELRAEIDATLAALQPKATGALAQRQRTPKRHRNRAH